jgi:magnesium transporter
MLTGYVYRNKSLEKINSKKFEGFKDKMARFWIDYEDITKEEIDQLTDFIVLHPVTIEDLQEKDETTRIKYEPFDKYTFLSYAGIKKIEKDYVDPYFVYVLIGDNFIITFHKQDNNIISDLKNNTKLLKINLFKGVDHLFHKLLDKEINLYYPVIENLETNIEKADKKILINEEEELNNLFDKKSINSDLRKTITSTSYMVLRIIKSSESYIKKETIIYFRDIYDDLVRMNQTLQSSKEQISTIILENNSRISSNMNETMKVLTIIATIMMPLTL